MPPQNMSLCYTDYFELKALENSKFGERLSLNSPYVPEDRSTKGTQLLHKYLPGDLHQPGKIDSSQKTVSPHHTQANFVTKYYISHLFF